ncbi:hypothetical protein Tco_1047990 [Tanacetum coccineum]
MDDEPMWAAERVVALTPGSAITIPQTENEFAIKYNHLTLVKGNQFVGRTKNDPHKHIHEFLGIYVMFKYRDTKNEVVRLMMFPLSLTGEAKTWLKMDNPNITMEEYIRLQEEKALSQGETFNWQTATYGKMEYYEDEDDCFTNFESEFPAIVLDNTITSREAISCGPTVSPLNDNEIDFRISFDESDDEDYTVVYDENSFAYKIIFVKNLKTDSENDNDKVNMTSFPSPEPEVNLLTEPTISPRHIDEFDLKYETSFSEYDEEEQNILYFNDLFPFNVIYPDDLKSDTDNNNKIDIERPSGDMSVTPIPENLYVPFGIPFDPKLFYKDEIKLGNHTAYPGVWDTAY